MVCQDRLYRFSVILSFSISLWALGGFYLCPPSVADETYVENRFYLVRIIEKSKDKLLFSVLNKKTKEVKDILFQGRYASINKMIFYKKSTFVVIGKLQRGGNIISVVRLDEDDMKDTIRAYDFSFSPSKRFLVYQTHYPKMAIPEFRRSIILIYDMEKSVSDNRLPSTLNYSHRNAGLPIFPDTNVKKKSYGIALEDKHIYLSPFLWSDDEKKVLFLEFYQLQNYIVCINFNEGINAPEILRKRINIEDIIRRDDISDITKKELIGRPYKLAVKGIRWSGSKEVIIEPYPQYWLYKQIKLMIPDKK